MFHSIFQKQSQCRRLLAVDQLLDIAQVDSEQTAALGLLLKYTVEHLVDGKRTIAETAQWLEQKLEQEGMVFAAEHGVISGGYAIPRIQEIYSCLNRYRV